MSLHNDLEWYEFGEVDFQENEAPEGELTRDDILEGLNSDEEPEEEEKEEEPKKEEEEEEEKEDEEKIDIEDEEEEEDKKKDEEDAEDILAPLSRKLVLKKYPNIFKDFPQLEKGYYGNIEYRKIFTTVKEASEAADRLENFGAVERELKNGDQSSLLKNLKEDNEDNFAKLVDSYLPTLEKVDEKAYFHVIGNVIKRACLSMAEASKVKNDEDLLTAAKILKGYMFGDAPIEGITSFRKNASPEADKLQEDRNKFNNERLEIRKGEISNRVSSMIESTLRKHIDPRDAMSAYVKKNAINDARMTVDELIGKDKEFQKFVDRMWQSALKDNFSEESTKRVRDAYLSKAKTLLPQVIRKIRGEALQGSGRGDKKPRESNVVLRGSKSAPKKDGKDDDRGKDRYKGMSTLEALNTD